MYSYSTVMVCAIIYNSSLPVMFPMDSRSETFLEYRPFVRMACGKRGTYGYIDLKAVSLAEFINHLSTETMKDRNRFIEMPQDQTNHSPTSQEIGQQIVRGSIFGPNAQSNLWLETGASWEQWRHSKFAQNQSNNEVLGRENSLNTLDSWKTLFDTHLTTSARVLVSSHQEGSDSVLVVKYYLPTLLQPIEDE